MSKKQPKINRAKLEKLKAKKAAEKIVVDEQKEQEVFIDYDTFTVDGFKPGNPLSYKYAIPYQQTADVLPMFWDDTPPPLVTQVLFAEEESDRLTPDWMGWANVHFITKSFFFNDFGHFRKQIEKGRFANIEEAQLYALKVLTIVNDMHQGAISGDVLYNSLMRLFGMNEKQVQGIHGMEFFKMVELAWQVGHAQSVMKTKAALQSKAEDGDLEAQKTLLKYEGILTAENAPASGGGELHFHFDAEDAKA